VLAGTALLTARSRQNLSAFNLDFQGLTVRSIEVNHKAATWARAGGELTVTPRSGLPRNASFTVEVAYDGVPDEIEGGGAGFIPTDDGAVVAGQPDVAATWFPSNDHPSDKATFDMELTAPTGLEVVSNGRLRGTDDNDDGTSTWHWQATEPMATYLATMNVGEFDTTAYLKDGVRDYDAIDPDLLVGPENVFDLAVYYRGAMTLHQLRLQVGDDAFFRTLQRWFLRHDGGNVTIEQFIDLAERTSGQDLDAFFDTWLFTPGRPEVGVGLGRPGGAGAAGRDVDAAHGAPAPADPAQVGRRLDRPRPANCVEPKGEQRL
jgi:aminopeptidase N